MSFPHLPLAGVRHQRRQSAAIAALLAAVLAVTLFGPGLARAFTDRLQHDSGAAPGGSGDLAVPVASAPSTNQSSESADGLESTDSPASTVESTAAPTDSTEADITPLTTTVTPTTSTPVPSAPTSATSTTAVEPVTMLQTVPAVRDVIVEIGGVLMATDSNGRITVADGLRGTITVIGRESDPSLQQAQFSSWADGNTQPSRDAGELHGPVAQVGVTVLSRIITTVDGVADGATPPTSAATFTSEAGPLTLTLGQPQWVPAIRAVIAGGGFAEQALHYTATSISTDGADSPVAPQQFVPTPEALWEITP